MVKAMGDMAAFKVLPKMLLQAIAGISAGDVRSAINCAKLVVMQLHNSPQRKVDVSL
jgi:hypothetical protein